MREFLYVDDLADACVHLMQRGYDGPLVIESFDPGFEELNRLCAIWRKFAATGEELAVRGLANLKQIDKSVEEAAVSLGAVLLVAASLVPAAFVSHPLPHTNFLADAAVRLAAHAFDAAHHRYFPVLCHRSARLEYDLNIGVSHS